MARNTMTDAEKGWARWAAQVYGSVQPVRLKPVKMYLVPLADTLHIMKANGYLTGPRDITAKDLWKLAVKLGLDVQVEHYKDDMPRLVVGRKRPR